MLSLVGLWGLVNNAGIAYVMPVEWTPISIFKRTADVNLWGMIEMTKTFLPLVKRDQGRVVNIGSMAGKRNTEVIAAQIILSIFAFLKR